jgi:hypothetical protein
LPLLIHEIISSSLRTFGYDDSMDPAVLGAELPSAGSDQTEAWCESALDRRHCDSITLASFEKSNVMLNRHVHGLALVPSALLVRLALCICFPSCFRDLFGRCNSPQRGLQ